MTEVGKLRRQLHLVEERLLCLRGGHHEIEGRSVVILPVVTQRIALAEPVRRYGICEKTRPEVRRRKFFGELPVRFVDVLLRQSRQRTEHEETSGNAEGALR